MVDGACDSFYFLHTIEETNWRTGYDCNEWQNSLSKDLTHEIFSKDLSLCNFLSHDKTLDFWICTLFLKNETMLVMLRIKNPFKFTFKIMWQFYQKI
jgi:hypothetical protein